MDDGANRNDNLHNCKHKTPVARLSVALRTFGNEKGSAMEYEYTLKALAPSWLIYFVTFPHKASLTVS